MAVAQSLGTWTPITRWYPKKMEQTTSHYPPQKQLQLVTDSKVRTIGLASVVEIHAGPVRMAFAVRVAAPPCGMVERRVFGPSRRNHQTVPEGSEDRLTHQPAHLSDMWRKSAARETSRRNAEDHRHLGERNAPKRPVRDLQFNSVRDQTLESHPPVKTDLITSYTSWN